MGWNDPMRFTSDEEVDAYVDGMWEKADRELKLLKEDRFQALWFKIQRALSDARREGYP